MPDPRDVKFAAPLQAADQLMQNRHFAEAISLYEARLAAMPNDVAALLKLGICHLLNRSHQRFLDIHAQARALLAALPEVPDDVLALWRKYEGLVVKVTAGTMVIGSLALAGCSPHSSAHKYSGGVYQPPTKAEQANPGADLPKPPEDPLPVSSHRYSGGVYIPPIEIDKPKPLPTSSHKYSGGVYLNPRPDAHESV